MNYFRKILIGFTISLVILANSYSYDQTFVGYASAATNSNMTFSTIEDKIPFEILQQESQTPQQLKSATFLNIEKSLHGFSGMYLDDAGMLNVYTTDTNIKSVDKSILSDYVNPNDLAKGIVVKQSKHSWHKWIQLENILLQLFDKKDIGITTMGVDDKNQVYRIGFEKLDDSRKAFMTNFLVTHNIPQDMIQLIETGKIIPITGDDCSNNYAPVQVMPIAPGAEIGLANINTNQEACSPTQWSFTPHCTLGLIAKTSSGTTVGVTAGHCQGPNDWNTMTQKYTQPYSTTSQNSQHSYPNNGRYVGTATTTNTNLAYSDSLLTSMKEASNFQNIYNGVTYRLITGKFISIVGSPVCYMGATSGIEKCGTIALTGQTDSDGVISKTLSNQVHTNINPALGGDSGSPVYAYPNGDTTKSTVQFAGTAWCCGNSYMWYSPIQGIDSDQGTLTVAFPSCSPPSSGDWIVSSSCTIYGSAIAPANIIVQSNAELLIPSGVILNIDFTHYHLTVNSGSGVLIQRGGLIA